MLGGVAEAEAEQQPSDGELAHDRGAASDVHDVTGDQGRHPRSEGHPLGPGGHGREERERLGVRLLDGIAEEHAFPASGVSGDGQLDRFLRIVGRPVADPEAVLR